MEEKEDTEGAVAEAATGEVAMGVKWEEGKHLLCPCLVLEQTGCGIDRDVGKECCLCVHGHYAVKYQLHMGASRGRKSVECVL